MTIQQIRRKCLRLKKKQGKTYHDLCRKQSMTVSQPCNFMNGKDINAATLIKLADSLDQRIVLVPKELGTVVAELVREHEKNN